MTDPDPIFPFRLDRPDDYRRWKEVKLTEYPVSLKSLAVEVDDPKCTTSSEREALLGCVRRANMAVYVAAGREEADKEIPRRVGQQFGLNRLDGNYLADDDGITALAVYTEGDKPGYIPYTNRPINWHTDGYYNPMDRQIRGLILHCVRNAESGGENDLLDPEMVYIQLRDENPDYIRALMQPDVMVIPEGTDSEGGLRGPSAGPVFSSVRGETLHMRYTARKRNIGWKRESIVQEAVGYLEWVLATESPFALRVCLEPGMGLLCNNVLHTRTAFRDSVSGPGRLLYRARYFDRIKGNRLV